MALTARDQAYAVRLLAESLTEAASAVSRVAIEVCRYHGHHDTIGPITQAGFVPPMRSAVAEQRGDGLVGGELKRVVSDGGLNSSSSTPTDGCLDNGQTMTGRTDGVILGGRGRTGCDATGNEIIAVNTTPTSMQATSLPAMWVCLDTHTQLNSTKYMATV